MAVNRPAAIRVTLNDKSWTLELDDLTGLDARLFRQATGVPLAGVLAGEHTSDLDVLAGIVWLCRVKAGERRLSYEEVADDLGYDDDFDLDAAAPEAGGTSDPEG